MLKPLQKALAGWSPVGGAALDDPTVILAVLWPEIVGHEISQHSHPARLIAGQLQVTTRSSSWSHELSFLKERIVAAVRERFPRSEVEDIRFRVGRLPAAAALPGPMAARGASNRQPRRGERSQTAVEAVERFRSAVEAEQRAKRAAGWKECTSCRALIAPGRSALCIVCENASAQERAGLTARLLFEAPWLGYDGTAALVADLTKEEYDSIRRRLLSRWWVALEQARRQQRLSPDRHERLIASSYVVLKSNLPPAEIASATVRNVLGDELHELIYGQKE